MGGLSLMLIERDTPGFTRAPLKKMGSWASDTATLHFDDAQVPAENLIGPENGGFKVIMANFNDERFGMAYGANGFARVAFKEVLAYARLR
jgi:acyl-CoA dehydrogenase